MNQTKRTIETACFVLFLFVVGCIIDVLPIGKTFLLRDLCSVYYLFVSLVAILYFYRTVIDERARRYMVAIGSMIALLFVLRIEKYVAFEENVTAARYLWYAYYIPTLMIPQLSFSTALLVNNSTNKRSALSFISGTISSLLLVFVLTNDLHQMVFRFNNGLENVDDYSHGIIFYIVLFWSVLLMITALFLLLRKCSVTANKRLAVIPIAYVLFFFAWLVIIQLGVRPVILGNKPGEIPETISFLMGGVLVLCVSIGLIPSNISYNRLMSIAGFSAQITNADYEVVYRNPSAIEMTEEQLRHKEIMLDENTKMFRKDVSGGYAYWQIDISELNEINNELEDVKEALSEEEEIIRLDNELKEKQAKIEAKSKLYDDIAIRVYNQSMTIERLSKQAKEMPELFEQNMAMVCVFATYIKRLANLMLLASNNETINKIELLLSINESARYLRKMGIVADVIAGFEDNLISSVEAVSLYEAFQNLLERANKDLKAVSVIICDNEIKLSLEGAGVDLPEGVNGTVEIEDDITFVSLPIGKGGDAV